MTYLDAIILGILQGITEFLPISSSGHLVLGEYFLGLHAEGLKSFDIVVHMGSLLAIFIYFREDVWGMMKAFWGFVTFKPKWDDEYSKLIGLIVLGTIPAVAAGPLFADKIDGVFRGIVPVAICMVIVGFIFIAAEFLQKRVTKRSVNWKSALAIGLAQSVALLPGVSRSGSTIVCGLMSGLDRSQAARFSFLLGIPAIAGAGVFTFIQSFGVENAGEVDVALGVMAVGFLFSLIFGWLSVAFLMKYLKKHTLHIFAFYLIGIGFIALQNF